MKVGDKVKVIDALDAYFGQVGVIVKKAYLFDFCVEFYAGGDNAYNEEELALYSKDIVFKQGDHVYCKDFGKGVVKGEAKYPFDVEVKVRWWNTWSAMNEELTLVEPEISLIKKVKMKIIDLFKPKKLKLYEKYILDTSGNLNTDSSVWQEFMIKLAEKNGLEAFLKAKEAEEKAKKK